MNNPKPLPELHITEILDGMDPIEHVIQINTLDERGVTIGRIGDVKICATTPKAVWAKVSRKHATIYSTWNKSRSAHDIWLRPGFKDSGNQWVVSGNGTGIWIGDRPISDERPIQLRPGAIIKLVPKVSGYQCILEWGTYSEDGTPSTPPTVPIKADERDRLYFENRSLREQAEVKDIQIGALQNLSRQQRTLADEFKAQTELLSKQIKRERDINKTQDKKINRIRILGSVAVVALLLSLGIEIEQIEKILQVVAALASAGMIYTSMEKSEKA